MLPTKLKAIADSIRVQSGKTDLLTLDQMPTEILDLQSLAFEIVGGTTAPSNPKENTIWMNTNTEISSWDFSATQPYRRSKNKNLIVYPFTNTTLTSNGITWTDNKDGTFTANGTASAASYCRHSVKNDVDYGIILQPGTYHLSGTPSGGGTGTYQVELNYSSDGFVTSTWARDFGDGVTFTVNTESQARVQCYVYSGAKLSNVVFKPQLEKGSTATSFVKGDATGQVWIQTGADGAVAFDALKKNTIKVYPMSAKQYVGGAWVNKEAKIYQGGAWGKLIPDIVLFDSGDNTAVSGGWTKASGASMTLNTSLKIEVSAGHPGSNVMANNAVDLTDYSTIIVNCNEYSGGTYSKVFVGTTFGSSATAASVSITGKGEYTLDVSNLTGLYYVGLFTAYANYFSVNKLVVKA